MPVELTLLAIGSVMDVWRTCNGSAQTIITKERKEARAAVCMLTANRVQDGESRTMANCKSYTFFCEVTKTAGVIFVAWMSGM